MLDGLELNVPDGADWVPSLFTLRWESISISSPLATRMSLEAIIFLLRMARGTSGLGVRSRFLMGCRVIGGAVWPLALGLPWNAMTFMWAKVCIEWNKLKLASR